MSKSRDFLAELDDLTVPATVTIVEPVEDPMPSLKLFNKTERSILDLLLEGLSVDTIALRLAMPKSTIEAIATRKDIQEHLKLLSESLNQVELLRLKSLYNRILDEKITEADESASGLSKKDLLDVMKAYQELLAAERKNKEPEANQNVFINILKQVMD